ncbi:adenosylmethionine decarboxylase [Methanocaldococcus infernus]|uniref:S-adenosylmethionine decarboxylase proenzyme n=1 Tax=Methanocaldococcus infernus (strain DSM 11812 / JCM 15783 / ME) TaxID=573063 RepID=D5VTV3_METIM|nr:adenosylmethionine decarboxylase [Methanocaldococcus infernus]ADG14006.1 S-adenosylmethionine decarboxylase proenzyme [Methanocaldococcus infernus ME]
MFKHLGKHLILELWGCDRKALDDEEGIRDMLIKSVEACNATLICVKTHKFCPQGVTGVAVLAESHIAIHTYPEYGYAALDIFTCGEHTDPYKALDVLKEFLKPESWQIIDLKRGIMENMGTFELK